jgi:hypothetical protein
VISVRPRKWLLRLAMVLTIAAACPFSKAQNEDEPDPEVGARVARHPLLHHEQFDQHIFWPAESVEAARARLNQTLNLRLKRLDRQYLLTAAQKEKLLLAGQGDIKRTLDRVDELRKRFQLVKYERSGLMACLQEAERIHRSLDGGIFLVDSLGRFRSAVGEAAARLARVLDLTREQHRQLKTLLLEELLPPRQSGESSYAYIMYQLSRLPEAKVRPIFRDSQWKFLHELLTSWNSAGPFLKEDGFVFDQAPGAQERTVRRAKQ